MIKYIGSKRVLVPYITAAFSHLAPGSRVLDLFSGTSRVGYALKDRGLHVTANDHNAYAHALARCYVQADRDAVGVAAAKLIDELQHTPPRPGWFTETYCEQSRFFHPHNGGKIEAIREEIRARALPPDLEATALVSLMEAADRVDSTTGLQMAYLKSWAQRAHKPLELRLPRLLPGAGEALQSEASDAARAFRGHAAYVDPPYNQHSYLGNYHVWETLVRWDAPEVYGKARKRVDCRERKSPFNSKKLIAEALGDVLSALDTELVVLSFNSEGHLDREALLTLLERRGPVRVVSVDHKRYVGAQIGIFNPMGVKVGAVSHLTNQEHLFLVGQDVRRLDGIARRVRESLPEAA